jgi:hypothetical protein
MNDALGSSKLRNIIQRVEHVTSLVGGTSIGKAKYKKELKGPTFKSSYDMSIETIREIRKRHDEDGVRQIDLSAEYGYSPSVIHSIIKRKNKFKDVE